MAFVRKKRKKNQDYFYIVESYREGSDVRQRILEYIGTLDNLMKLALKGWQPNEDASSDGSELTFKAYTHGSCMALYWMARLIGIEDILDRTLPPKTVKGMKRSTVLLLAMIHRAIDPESKRAFAGWAAETSLPYHLKFKAKDLSSQSFWEAMDGISKEGIQNTNRAIVKRVMEMTGINPKTFHLDYTNYYTFINSKNGRCIICKRGHNKQKRNDLRQFSLAMLTSYTLQIPIIWDLYDGNKNDRQEFPDFADLVTNELIKYNINPEEATITFDGGSNSEENFKKIKFNFICSESLSGKKELYNIDINDYTEIKLENNHTRLAYRVENLEFCGITGTGILTYSEALKEGQVAELEKKISDIKDICEDFNERLKNPGSRIFTELQKMKLHVERTAKEAVEYNDEINKEGDKKGRRKKEKTIPVWDEGKAIIEIINNRFYKGKKELKEFTSFGLTRTGDTYQINLTIDEKTKKAYIRKFYGKKLTCTNVSEWSTQKILQEYLEQECIETNIFKVSKDTDHFSVRPQYHWTDDKIHVHTFICLTAMIVTEMLRIRFENNGIEITKPAMINKLTHIHDGWIFKNDKEVVRTVEKLDDEHQSLWNVVKSLYSEICSTNE